MTDTTSPDLLALYECIRDALQDAACDDMTDGYRCAQLINQFHGHVNHSLGAALEYARGWKEHKAEVAARPAMTDEECPF